MNWRRAPRSTRGRGVAASLVILIGMSALTAGSADREGAGAADGDDGQWHRPGRDSASTRHSGVYARVYLAPRWL